MKLLDKTKGMSQEQKFIAYLQNDTTFADLVQCSYEKRTVVFGRNDIYIIEINVKRKMLRALLTLFIKFKNFNSLHIEIYARDNMGYPKIYRAFAERKVFFDFVNDKIVNSRGNLANFGSFMYADTVCEFAEKFITSHEDI